jgi:hypothetical protein
MAWLLLLADNHTLVDSQVFHILHHSLVVPALLSLDMVLLAGELDSHIGAGNRAYHILHHN